MSIKGIENQMMIARSTDFARDSSAQLKRGELMQDFLSAAARASQEHQKQAVKKTGETERISLSRDKEDSNGGYSGGNNPPPGRGNDVDADDEQAVFGGEHIIDIKI